jgi:hypothetical protein
VSTASRVDLHHSDHVHTCEPRLGINEHTGEILFPP